jgi:hypothetical protein
MRQRMNRELGLHVAALGLMLMSGAAHADAPWGEGSFDNDDALFFASECTSAKSIAPVSKALNIANRSKSIEASDGAAAVAAAEVVAAALGQPNPKLPPALRDWIGRQSAAQLTALAPNARTALARVANPEFSELATEWSKGKPNTWPETIAELQGRLKQP